MAPTRGFCSRAGEMGMRHWRGAKWPLGDCTRDDKGSLAGCSSATPGDVGRCCASQCEACARCQYYSFAKDRRGRRGRRRNFTACRWYADTQCDMRDLRHSAGIHSKGEWQTVQAKRSVPAALPPDLGRASPLRLAIVGLTFGSSQHCGIVGWCQGARRLRRVLPVQWTVTIAVIGGKDPRSARRRGHACEGATHVAADGELGRLADACSRKTRRAWRGMPGTRGISVPPATILKWQLLAMDAYDALLFADLDVDLFPLESNTTLVGSAWLSRLPAFVRADQPIVVLANADHATPVNTGLMLVKPHRALHADGISRRDIAEIPPRYAGEYRDNARQATQGAVHRRYLMPVASTSTWHATRIPAHVSTSQQRPRGRSRRAAPMSPQLHTRLGRHRPSTCTQLPRAHLQRIRAERRVYWPEGAVGAAAEYVYAVRK